MVELEGEYPPKIGLYHIHLADFLCPYSLTGGVASGLQASLSVGSGDLSRFAVMCSMSVTPAQKEIVIADCPIDMYVLTRKVGALY